MSKEELHQIEELPDLKWLGMKATNALMSRFWNMYGK